MDVLTALIYWTVAGAIIGGIARLLMPGDQNLGCLMTIGLGILGSYVGGFISALVRRGELVFTHPSGWIMSIIGAIVVLFIAEKVWLQRGPPPEV